MKITALDKEGRETEASKIDGVYKCYPKSENRSEYAVTFERLEDAAVFLLLKPDWGIRMKSGSPIKYRGLSIVRDG